MLKFYYSTAPNPMKVALFLEEAGLEYDAIPVDTRAGDQHTDAFKMVNPNAKVPAIVDGETTMFDSNGILLYLAEKTGTYLGKNRGEMLSWLMFIASGIGPYSGQAVHFQHHAPEKLPYAINRYRFEAQRHYNILDARLAQRTYLLGDDYSIVDMAAWAWARLVPVVLGEEEAGAMVNLKRLVDQISARPAAERAIAIKDCHAFKTEMDEAALRNMFPSNY